MTQGGPLGQTAIASSTTDAVEHSTDLCELEGNEANTRSVIMAVTASMMAIHSTGDLVHGLPERLERTGSSLGHIVGGTAAGTAAAAATAASVEHVRQIGHRGVFHGKLGILILNIPPTVGQDLGTATPVRRRLLINADAPMVSVGAVSVDVVQGHAVTDGRVGPVR